MRRYADLVLTAFGANRVMWGSDWPVCRLRASYDEWFSAAQELTGNLSETEKARVFGGSAAEFYRLTC